MSGLPAVLDVEDLGAPGEVESRVHVGRHRRDQLCERRRTRRHRIGNPVDGRCLRRDRLSRIHERRPCRHAAIGEDAGGRHLDDAFAIHADAGGFEVHAHQWPVQDETGGKFSRQALYIHRSHGFVCVKGLGRRPTTLPFVREELTGRAGHG